MREKTLDALTESLKVLAIDLNDRMNRQPQESYSTRLFIGQVAYSVSLRAYKLDNHMNATKTEDLLRVYTGSLEFWSNKVSTSLLSDFQDSLENYKEDWYDNERRRSWESKTKKPITDYVFLLTYFYRDCHWNRGSRASNPANDSTEHSHTQFIASHCVQHIPHLTTSLLPKPNSPTFHGPTHPLHHPHKHPRHPRVPCRGPRTDSFRRLLHRRHLQLPCPLHLHPSHCRRQRHCRVPGYRVQGYCGGGQLARTRWRGDREAAEEVRSRGL